MAVSTELTSAGGGGGGGDCCREDVVVDTRLAGAPRDIVGKVDDGNIISFGDFLMLCFLEYSCPIIIISAL